MALIDINVRGLRDLQGRFASMADRDLANYRRDEMRHLSRLMLQALEREAPRRTGQLAKSFRFKTYETATALGARFTSNVPYALIVARGTRRKNYPIAPRTGKVLAMQKMEPVGPLAVRQGRTVFRPFVKKHPGIKANPFHVRALRALGPEWEAAWQRLGVRVVTQLAKRGAPV